MGQIVISLSCIFENTDKGLPTPTLLEQIKVKSSQVEARLNERAATLQTGIILQGLSDSHISKWKLVAAKSEADITAAVEKSYLNAKRQVALSFDEGRVKLGFQPLYDEQLPIIR